MICPNCSSNKISKHGRRKLKRRTAQIYKCQLCGKYFSENALKNKTYDENIILNSISYYNLGHTLSETKKIISKRFHKKVPISMIHSRIREYKTICTYDRLRKEAKKLATFNDIIFEIRLDHN